MENRFLEDFIFGDDIFCSTIEDLVEYLERDGDIEDLPEDWETKVELTELKKVQDNRTCQTSVPLRY
jgi:hypothetical protein